MDALWALAVGSDWVAQVRGAGLFIGVDIVTGRSSTEPNGALAAKIVNGLRERRVLISAPGPLATCSRSGGCCHSPPVTPTGCWKNSSRYSTACGRKTDQARQHSRSYAVP